MSQNFISVSRKPRYAFAELHGPEEVNQWRARSTLIERRESTGEVAERAHRRRVVCERRGPLPPTTTYRRL